ncbi:MAG: hypothetical protein HQK89_08820 [Nitrospirae bacterium]|nr:hypothetical protein [Nitrospirota bacterium]
MATLPLEVYEVFEDKIVKEDARVIVKSIELTITGNIESKWASTKNELLDGIKKEIDSKHDLLRQEFDGKHDLLRQEFALLRQEFDLSRKDSDSKFETLMKEFAEVKREFAEAKKDSDNKFQAMKNEFATKADLQLLESKRKRTVLSISNHRFSDQ